MLLPLRGERRGSARRGAASAGAGCAPSRGSAAQGRGGTGREGKGRGRAALRRQKRMSGALRGAAPAAGRRRRRGGAEPTAGLRGGGCAVEGGVSRPWPPRFPPFLLFPRCRLAQVGRGGGPGFPREPLPGRPRPRNSVRREKRKVLCGGREALAQRRSRRGGGGGGGGEGCPGSPVPPRLAARAKSATTARLGRARGGDANRGSARGSRRSGGVWNNLTLPEPGKNQLRAVASEIFAAVAGTNVRHRFLSYFCVCV